MLVLGRQRNESIFFDVQPSDTPTRITVMVVRIQGDRFRLGCDAPKHVNIARAELAGRDESGATA